MPTLQATAFFYFVSSIFAFENEELRFKMNLKNTPSHKLHSNTADAIHLSELTALPQTTCSNKSFENTYPCSGGDFWFFEDYNMCIYLSSNYATWTKARETCQSYGADLVRIRNKKFEDELINTLEKKETLSQSVAGFWIALTFDHQLKSWAWVHGEPVPTYLNWGSPEPKHPKNSEKRCIVTYAHSTWMSRICERNFRFICQRESATHMLAPTITVQKPDEGSEVFRLDNMTIRCYVPVPGMTEWMYSQVAILPVGEKSFKTINTKEELLPIESDQFTFYNNVCMRVMEFGYTQRIMGGLDGGKVLCCSTHPKSGQQRCSESQHVYRYWPRKPTMRAAFDEPSWVVYPGSRLQATCSAYVGSNGTLTWALLTRNGGVHFWQQTGSGGVKGRSAFGVHVIGDEVKFSEMKGTFLKSTMVIQSVRTRHDGSTVSCLSHNVQEITNQPSDSRNKLRGVKGVIKVRYPPREPKLTVYFHTEPDIVYNGFTLRAKCTASMGTSRRLVWVWDNVVPVTWAVDVKHRTLVAGPKTGVDITTTSEFLDVIKGYHVTSQIKIKANHTMDKSILMCYSRYQMKGKPDLWHESLPISLYYLPQSPNLTLTYIDQSSVLLSKTELQATCTAAVGTNGVLTWVLQTPAHTHRLWINSKTNMYPPGEDEHHYVHVTADVVHSLTDGMVVTSNMTVQVTEDMKGDVLACFSYNYTSEKNLNISEGFTDELRNVTAIEWKAKKYSMLYEFFKTFYTEMSMAWLVFGALMIGSVITLFFVFGFLKCRQKEEALQAQSEEYFRSSEGRYYDDPSYFTLSNSRMTSATSGYTSTYDRSSYSQSYTRRTERTTTTTQA